MATLEPGSLLDRRYRVVQTLAKGGFGQTYIAEDTRRPGNPRCVVKHLKPASNDSRFLENARRLFSTEAEILEKLGTHDQIPRLLAYFEEEREFYLVQDLIEGHTLTHELQMGHRWSEAQICQLLRDVLNVLAFVHHYGVIHRDIKPENLIRRQQDNKLVLVDFGTVKQIRTQPQAPGHISITIAVGTPGYMPTEQNHGKPRPNSDLYALGIIGLQAATGLLPGQLQDDPETGELVWQPWAQQIRPDLATILSRLVRYHFKERYQSAIEVLQSLDELLNHHLDLAAEVETQPPPTIVSNLPAIASPPRLSKPPLPPTNATVPATNPVVITGLSNPIGTGVVSASAVSQPLAPINSLGATDSPTAMNIRTEDTAADFPTSLWTEQLETTEIPSETVEVVSQLTPATTEATEPLSTPSTQTSTQLPSSTNEQRLQRDRPFASDDPFQLAAQSFQPPATRIDSPSQIERLRGSLSHLPLSRITAQPVWIGLGAVMIALLLSLPTLLKVLPIGSPRLAQAPGLRNIFAPAQQSLSKVLLMNLPCQTLLPESSLTNPIIYPDGTEYYGVFQNNAPANGRGVLIFPNGSRYDGEFRGGSFNGCGQYTYAERENYSYYIGQFQNNAFNGLGTLTFDGGDRYIGEFRNGRCHGTGTFITANGTLKRSEWREGNSIDGDNTVSCSRTN